MMQGLVHAAHIFGSQPGSHGLDALACARQQQTGGLRDPLLDTIREQHAVHQVGISDILPSITVSPDGKEIHFSGGFIPQGGRFTDIQLAA